LVVAGTVVETMVVPLETTIVVMGSVPCFCVETAIAVVGAGSVSGRSLRYESPPRDVDAVRQALRRSVSVGQASRGPAAHAHRNGSATSAQARKSSHTWERLDNQSFATTNRRTTRLAAARPRIATVKVAARAFPMSATGVPPPTLLACIAWRKRAGGVRGPERLNLSCWRTDPADR